MDYIIVLYASMTDQSGGEIGGICIKAPNEERARDVAKRFVKNCYFTIRREYKHANN